MSEWCVPLPARDLGFWESYPISPAWCLDSRERRLWESLPSIQHPPLRQSTATETGPSCPSRAREEQWDGGTAPPSRSPINH